MTPNFLVIGAQKSGTAWLFQNLKTHPQIWMPPEKEIHFFDFPPLIPFYFLLFAPERPIRHWAKNRMIRDYQKVMVGEQTAAWNIRYYFYLRTRKWYLSLFTPGEAQIAGEITPRYSILSERSVAKVHKLMPDIKIIYLLRNPIDRMWSDAAMYHSARFGCEGLHTANEQSIIKFLKDPGHLASSDYLNNLERWEKFYSPSQIFVGFFEQLSDTPKEFLQSIYQFLEVDASEQYISTIAYEKINARDYPDMPEPVTRMLAETLIKEIARLHQRFDNPYTAEWLDSTQKYLL